MKQEKPSLAKALPVELGTPFFAEVTGGERAKLNNHVRKQGGKVRLSKEVEAALIMAIWNRTTGIELPAALTIHPIGYEPEARIVTGLGLYYCDWNERWQIRVEGFNIRTTGATGNKRETMFVPLDRPIAMARRDLAGKWVPFEVSVVEEAC